MEDVESDDAARDGTIPCEPIKEAGTTMDEEDAKLVYDHTCFQRDKVKCRYFRYYYRHKIIIKKGATREEFDEHALRVWATLDAQGWTDMVKDHRPTVEAIVWEFYVNLHQRLGDSFHTWLRETTIEVTFTLISTITRAPHVRDPDYPYPIDHPPTDADLVECFVEGRPHQMELDGESSFQMSNFSNDVWCNYHILASRVLPIISQMMITIEKARCLYALLTKTPIDYSSVVTSTMMLVRLLDKGFRVTIRGPNHSNYEALQGGHDRAKGGPARKGSHGRTVPQHKSGSLVGGRARAESAATTEESPSWQGTC
jgi:hypothetical protein